MIKFVELLLLLTILLIEFVAGTKPVSVFDKNIGQLVTSSLLTWESFNPSNPKHQLEYAVSAGEFLEKYPAYICRSTVDSIAVTGYVKKRSDESYVCIVSMHSQIKTKGDFELLMNKGNGAKTDWQDWEKNGIVFSHIDGTVSTINSGLRSEIYYIARHKKSHSMEHHEIDHAIGWFDPKEGFGKIHATVASSEQTFDNGQILVAFEAVHYELHDIKFSTIKLKIDTNRTLLGQTMLRNEGEQPAEVNAVIGYEYNLTRNLGHHEAIARSVNTTVFVAKKEVYNCFWGIETNNHVMQTKGVSTTLQPGTALNISLWGNYTIRDGPYDAQLIIHWADGTKSKKRRIRVNAGYEANLEDQLEIDYSPTFWLHNNTVVPTTTTQRTTTSTTSSSTTHRSIFSTISNNAIERITEKTSMKDDESEENDDAENEIKADEINSSSNIQVKSCIITFIIINLIRLIAH
ncbi:protein unzipped [Chironomus tepperi]|uniref:protein unzipped n=1 Tax=Chironomus tepperi TaxID=113505 RepID=UPI00391F7A4C